MEQAKQGDSGEGIGIEQAKGLIEIAGIHAQIVNMAHEAADMIDMIIDILKNGSLDRSGLAGTGFAGIAPVLKGIEVARRGSPSL